ncbi:septal ring lytic transglycosylase RlpA family protein [Spiractinospora alimapuensis]|nr:septal ring lytic transglycosylase RlpA family protein [Spiractinospora alimapuensis]
MFGGDTPEEPQAVETTEAAALPFGEPQGRTDADLEDAEQRRQDAGDDATQTGSGSAQAEAEPESEETEDAPEPEPAATEDSTGTDDSADASDSSDESGDSDGSDSGPSAAATPSGEGGTCEASNYGEGQMTANGERFDPNAMTAAHKTLPFDTMVEVTNPANGRSVTVRINDRGPFVEGRCLDLSRAAFEEIASASQGVATVDWQVVE